MDFGLSDEQQLLESTVRGFRAEERYGLVVVDGALVWGGLSAWLVAPLLA